MQTGYFGEGEDCSDWFASVTTISGCMNGAPIAHGFYVDQDTCMADVKSRMGALFWNSVEMASLGLNILAGPKCNYTMENVGEIISRRIYTGHVHKSG